MTQRHNDVHLAALQTVPKNYKAILSLINNIQYSYIMVSAVYKRQRQQLLSSQLGTRATKE